MEKYRTLILAVLGLLVLSQKAEAAQDPCYMQERTLSQAERSLSTAQSRLSQAEVRLARLQDQIASRQYAYQAQIAQAQAYASVTTTIVSVGLAQCALRRFSGFGVGYCIVRSSGSRFGALARAQALVNSAVARSNAYNTYAQGALYREGLRITSAQDDYNAQTTTYQTAQSDYSQCQTAYPTR